MKGSLCNCTLSLLLVFVFSSLANAAEHFSFAGFDLSLTPQQVIDKAVQNLVPGAQIGTSFEPEQKSNKVETLYYKHNHPTIYLSDYEIVQRIFPLPKEDIKIASDIHHFIDYCRANNTIGDNHKLIVDKVQFSNAQQEVGITGTYITMPGFKQRPLALLVNSVKFEDIRDVFNQRYGQSKKLPGTEIWMDERHQEQIYWENDKEIAVLMEKSQDKCLMIIDKEAYKAMMQFVASEIPRVVAEQEAKKKAAEDAKKGGI